MTVTFTPAALREMTAGQINRIVTGIVGLQKYDDPDREPQIWACESFNSIFAAIRCWATTQKRKDAFRYELFVAYGVLDIDAIFFEYTPRDFAHALILAVQDFAEDDADER